MVSTTTARSLLASNINDNTTGDISAADVRGVISAALDGVDAAAASSITVSAGAGLSGGGDLTANRTLTLDINGLTADATPNGAADYVVTYDASATGLKKVLINNLPVTGSGKTYFSVNIVTDYSADPTGNSANATANTTAFNNALSALATAGGGTLFVPRGRYILNGTLTIPNMTSTDDSWNSIEIRGEGMRNTVLEWPTDLGAGTFGIAAANRVTNYVRLQMSDIALYGPRDADALGTAPAAMSGIGVSNRMILRRVMAIWWKAGVDIIGDHSMFDYCEFTKNLYGAYWGNDVTTKGDQYFNGCEMSGNKLASLGVNPVNAIDSCTFSSCHFGFSPYGVFLETGTRTVAGMSNTLMLDCSFEAVGNGSLFAEGTTSGHDFIANTFINCSGSQISAYKLGASAFTAFVKCQTFDRNALIGGHGFFGPYQTTPTGYIAATCSFNRFEDLWNCYPTSSVPFIAGGVGWNTYIHPAGHSGFVGTIYNTCAVGDVLGDSFDGYAQLPSGATAAGIAMTAATNAGAWIATQGVVVINKTSGAAIAVGAPVQSNATNRHQVETATASTRPIVATAKFAAASGDAQVVARINITHRM